MDETQDKLNICNEGKQRNPVHDACMIQLLKKKF